MPSLRLGPLRFSRHLYAAQAVRHGPLHVVPVLQLQELAWLGARQTLVLRRARPDHVEIVTFAGTRRVAVEAPAPVARALIIVGIVAPVLAWLAAGRISTRTKEQDHAV